MVLTVLLKQEIGIFTFAIKQNPGKGSVKLQFVDFVETQDNLDEELKLRMGVNIQLHRNTE